MLIGVRNIMNIIIVSHKAVTQPDDDLVFFLNKNKFDNVLHIRHEFISTPKVCSYYTWYKKGKIYKQFETGEYKKWSEPFIYIKEFYYNTLWVFFSGIKWDCYIGMDGLCVFFGNVLRFLGRIKKTIFWAMDFVPKNRFNSGIKNKIYRYINVCGYKRSNEMWDLSPRMAEARENFLNITKKDYKLHKIVPYGAWTNRIKKYNYNDCEKNTVVFMGHLLEKQGVQLIIKIIPEIIKKNPNFIFKIIGDGKFKDNLVKLAEDLNVLKYCDFKGKIENYKELENEIAKSCLAVAPYIKALDTWTYYADPGKIKTYLACGVPVLLTDIPWNAEEIEENKCGKIITENKDDIISGILEFMGGNKNQEYRENAINYSKKFDYENIFNNLNL